MKRRRSAGPDGRTDEGAPIPVKASLDEVKRQFRLGPANRAANPLSTRGTVFKIKQGLGTPLIDGKPPPRPASAADNIKPNGSGSSESAPLLERNHTTSGSPLTEGYGSSDI
jgi:metal transporter CNNM